MNNSKVRIYDLSKELHLENKEIIQICEYLNIPVKSHSSTITEDEADRIKATAEKDKDGKLWGKKAAKIKKNGGKQEILVVHHKPNLKPNRAKSTPTAQKPTPPRPVESVPTPPTPVLSKPSLSPPPTPSQPEATPPPVSETPETSDSPAIPANDIQTEQTEMPQLLNPPSRSDQKEKVSSIPSPSALPKPIPKPTLAKKDKLKSKNKEKEKDSKEGTNLTPVEKKGKKESGKRPEKSSEAIPKKPKKAKASDGEIELKRPQSPKAEIPTLAPPPSKPEPAPDLDDENEAEDTIDTELPPSHKKPKQKLKRPTLPTTVKGKAKGSKWEEEEEEKALKEKNSKTGKNKRRKPIIEDDDELETALNDQVPTTNFSLSTARPPKPQSDKPTSPPTSKPKKPPIKAGQAQAPSRSRNERRERKEPVRPEIIELQGSLTVRELADLIQVSETDIIKHLFFKGIAINITQTLDLDIAKQVAEEFDILVDTPEAKAAAAKDKEMLDDDDLDNLQRRPPVVTIMGHVDHGKTTLLDSIRKTKVAQGEAGGITQHIGAYHVDVEHNNEPQQIVFLDTPGHEAFTAMRARGAKVTDIAILVVAADDGVQPQTREAISHAQAAEVPLIVAINKVDKPEANPDRIKQELSELGLVTEEWGGDTTMVPVSALKGQNLDELLEMILLVSDLEEMSANPDRLAKGTVIEAHLDRARGPVATLLVQNGTLRVGDVIVAGAVMGKIRAMIDDRGNKVEAASPSFAVEILGLGEVPSAGDEFDVLDSEKEAKAIADQRSMEQRENRLQKAMSGRKVSLSTISAQAEEGELKELNLIIKADVQGSVEAIVGALEQLPQDEVQIRILLASPGEVTETDVDLAAASGAVVIGFNTTLASNSRAAADREEVDIREYDIIYKLLDDIQGAMEGLLDPEEVESDLGTAEVRAVFPVGRGAVAGCYIQSGKVVRNRLMRIRRKGKVIFEGGIDSLKRMKEDAREVNSGYECGIGSSKFADWQEGDIIEAYEMVMQRRTLANK
ncbi:MAG: translation initiation factor IF-2 [Microcystaceae cyanobacterium]